MAQQDGHRHPIAPGTVAARAVVKGVGLSLSVRDEREGQRYDLEMPAPVDVSDVETVVALAAGHEANAALLLDAVELEHGVAEVEGLNCLGPRSVGRTHHQ